MSLRARIQAVMVNASIMYRVHYGLAFMWLLLMWPTTTSWKNSILWVGLISCYANFVSHWGGGQAALSQLVAGRAEGAAAKVGETVRRGAVKDTEMLQRIEKEVTQDEEPNDC
jgi:hypothetical protein